MNSLKRNKLSLLARWLIGLVGLVAGISTFAQGTAFTYQGDLNQSGRPANGLFNVNASSLCGVKDGYETR